MQSKSHKPLTRYLPDLVAALAELKATKYLLDGEIVIPVDGHLSFDDLLMRLHPAASRVKKLSESKPCMFIVFGLLVDEKGSILLSLPLEERRKRLEAFAKKFLVERPSVRLSTVTDGAPSTPWNGSHSITSLSSRWNSITSPAGAFVTGRNSCAGVPTKHPADCTMDQVKRENRWALTLL